MKMGNVLLEVRKGNIAEQSDITAIVNAANAELRTGGGVAGAIHRAAGPGLEAETRHWAPIKPGEAVTTNAHKLPNKFVIHCLGPIYGVDQPADKLLADCYRNAILRAEEKKIESIAFPAISTGAFGYPFEEATDVAFTSIREMCPKTKHLKLIRFVLFSETDLESYQSRLNPN